MRSRPGDEDAGVTRGPGMARPRHRSGNLPAEATTFVGRRRELGEIRKKLATARLVSLVGPGGVGKTRLAVRAGTELARSFADGAWLVELGEVRNAAVVTDAVLAALDLRDQAGATPIEILLSYVRGGASSSSSTTVSTFSTRLPSSSATCSAPHQMCG